MEVPAAARNILLHPVNDISRNIHPILDVNMRPREAVQDPREPEQQRGARAPRPGHDPMRAIKDSRPYRIVSFE